MQIINFINLQAVKNTFKINETLKSVDFHIFRYNSIDVSYNIEGVYYFEEMEKNQSYKCKWRPPLIWR